MGLAGSCSADQHGVTLLGEKGARREVADRSLVDERTLESEVVDVLGERQSCDGELVLDRTGLLFRDLGFEQVAAEALRLVAPLGDGQRLVVGGLHAVELERPHHVEDFGSFHHQALLKAS